HCFHAITTIGFIQGLSFTEIHYPSRWRSGSLPLGPLPGDCAGSETPATRGTSAAKCLLRYLRISSAGHRFIDQGNSRGEYFICVRDVGGGQRNRFANGALFR